MVVINTPAGSNLETAPYIVSYNDLLEQGVDMTGNRSGIWRPGYAAVPAERQAYQGMHAK